jgi:hypothetical protein
VKQPDAQALFETRDGLTDRGARQRQSLGGFGKAARLDCLDKDLHSIKPVSHQADPREERPIDWRTSGTKEEKNDF